MRHLQLWERVASIGGAFGLGGLALPRLGEWCGPLAWVLAWLLVVGGAALKIALYVKAKRMSA